MKLKWCLFTLLLASPVQAYDCMSNCTEAAKHRVNLPCPTWDKPGRTCPNVVFDPAEKALCETQREASCKVFEDIYDYVKDKVRPELEKNFNARTWQKADEEDKEQEYDIQCRAAGVAICAAIGAEFGGPWGAALSGSVGLFVSTRLCEQSKSW